MHGSLIDLDYKTENLGFGSFMPALAAMFHRFQPRHVYEFGMGYFSTPVFNALPPGCTALSVDNKREWVERFRPIAHPSHVMLFEADLVLFAKHLAESAHYPDLVFVDSQPANERGLIVEAFKDVAQVIVVHDAGWEEQKESGLDKIVETFDHRAMFRSLHPATIILSNRVAL